MEKKTLLFTLLFLVLLSFILATPAYAITFRSSEGKLTIPEDKTIEGDLYASGENVEIDGTVNGDLIVGGGTIAIDGEISGDLTAAAGVIFLNGEVKDDVRIAGGTIHVGGRIGGDLIAAGGQVIVSEESEIKEDALFGCGTLQADGSVGKNLWAGAGSIQLDGRVGNNSRITADNVSLGPDAEINGNLLYVSSKKANIDSGAQIRGKVTHKLPPKEVRKARTPLAGLASLFFYLLFSLISFIATLITAFIFIALFPKAATETSQTLAKKLWASLGIGFLALIVIPIAAIMLIITLVGLPLGMISFALYFIFIYLSQIVFSVFLGEKILLGITKKEGVSPYLSVFIGLVILAVLGFIPFLGWLLKFVVMLFGLGALVLATFGMMQKAKEPVATGSTTK